MDPPKTSPRYAPVYTLHIPLLIVIIIVIIIISLLLTPINAKKGRRQKFALLEKDEFVVI